MHSLPNDMSMDSAHAVPGAAEAAVARQLRQLGLPGAEWTVPRPGPDGQPLLDAVVIGGGMYGVSCAAELWARGLRNILILERNPEGREGPWTTYARMPTLRSPKTLPGISLGTGALTFPAWYEATFGKAAWEALYKVPNAVWVDYIAWVRRTLALPMQSGVAVTALRPAADHVALDCEDGRTLYAKRVVVATGRAATGGWSLPAGVDPALLSTGRAAHTSQEIDFAALRGRRVAVIGAGASAWDNAATALEAGAASVEMFCRRLALPQVNKGRAHSNAGFAEGWMDLDDAQRWTLTTYLDSMPAPPPHETVLRTCRHPGFVIRFGTRITHAVPTAEGLSARISTGEEKAYDFLILGTGFRVDLMQEPLFAGLHEAIRLWGDCFVPPRPGAEHLLRMPYLGRHFELLEKPGHTLAGLERVHLFNAAGFLSVGNLSLDVPTLSAGGHWLAARVCQKLFAEEFDAVLGQLRRWEGEHELAPTPFYAPDFINRTGRAAETETP
ncbi:NAD(P)/FAD-dependent oxidoreductase [Pseudooceanicola sp. CBS1P-1]|uniref:SidA/IucD/PvdA family monooxygenase n=1 Tax=Pseudooceanicola albus TaxID=2692189 RepID=A0A6L7G837_9RHOB|nr:MULTISPECIES: NAD(P)/FAD-dependent oxidoreductase [Pseudooceanicola]MBT9386082.1 NAD(P)/FAD-dependent oxidoreductase [Pseudooceanicola endophyticus]MXN19500.1 SidA/IucD/PvdA family monooxygenase [Pseudooceanicola albus]